MKRFKKILFVAGSTQQNSYALEQAVKLADENQATLTVVEVVECVTCGIGMPPGGPISAELQAALVDEQTQKLKKLVEPYHNQAKIDTTVLVGTAFMEIIREVLRKGFDLVIKIPEYQSFMNRLFGSDDMHLLRKCPCPVWLISASSSARFRKIMAMVDFDPFDPKPEDGVINRKILEMSSSLALAQFCELHIVHVWRALGESSLRFGFEQQPEADVDAYVEGIREKHQQHLDALVAEFVSNTGRDAVDYIKPQIHLVKGFARDVVPQLVKENQIDLVTMGTVGRTGIPGFIMGNTAETILSQINCSVLAIKPQGFVTPVTLAQ